MDGVSSIKGVGQPAQAGPGMARGRHEASGEGSESWRRVMPLSWQGEPGYVQLRPGAMPGRVHVSIRVDAPLAERPDAQAPLLAIDASVTSSWLTAVTRGASTQNEQAKRIAEALRAASEQGAAGRGGVKSEGLLVDAVLIRGPLRPEPPFVWLPGDYPPPVDDAVLRAELVHGRQ